MAVGATTSQPDRRGALSPVRALERALDAAPAEELPAYLGELERLKAVVLVRLLGARGVPQPTPPGAERLLTTREVAGILRRGTDHVLDLVRRRHLVPLRLPNGFRFRPAEVERYLRDQ